MVNFYFLKEVLYWVPPLVDCHIAERWILVMRFWWNNDLNAKFSQEIAKLIRIKSLVRQEALVGTSANDSRVFTKSCVCLGISLKAMKLSKASVTARIFVVMPPLDLPIAWL